MPIDVKKYIDVDSQDTPIIRYVEKNVVEKRYGVDVTDLLGMVNANGGYDYPNGGNTPDFSNLTGGIPEHGLAYKFYKSGIVGDVVINISFARDGSFLRAFEQSYITGFFADRLGEITNIECFQEAFRYCPRLKKVSFKNLRVVSSSNANANIFRNAFYYSGLEEADFSGVEEIAGNYVFLGAFEGTKIKNNPMPNLKTINYMSPLGRSFAGCNQIETFVFDNLINIIGAAALSGAFNGCQNFRELQFPKLLNVASNNSLSGILAGCSGVTVHFPSNLESVIGEWSNVVNGFGGTNTTVLFDLPSTDENESPGGGGSGDIIEDE